MEGNYDWKIVLLDGTHINVWKPSDEAYHPATAVGEVEYDDKIIEIRWERDKTRTTIPWTSVIRLDERASVVEGVR